MTLNANSFATWLGDFFLLSTALLTLTLIALAALKQPAHRLAVTKATLGSLALLAALCALPRASVIHLMSAKPTDSPQTISHIEPVPATASILAPQKDTAPTPTVAPNTVASSTPPIEAAPSRATWHINWPTALVTTYLAGALVVTAWLALGILAARRLRRSTITAPQHLVDLFHRIALHTRIDLRTSDRITVPVALGILRPAILLPFSAAASQSAIRNPQTAIAPILAHELAHIRNRDLHWLAVTRALHILHWPNPLYYLLRRRMRLDQERLADAAAAEHSTREEYAEQLITWARTATHTRGPRIATAVGLWESSSQLRRRIATLIDDRLTILHRGSHAWRFGSFVVCAVAALALSIVTLSPAQTELPPSSTTKEPLRADKGSKVADGDKATSDSNHGLTVVITKNLMLLDGKEIITWEELEKRIAADPKPSELNPQFYFTNGAYESKMYEAAKPIIWQLHKKYKLKGHSEGSLLPRTGAWYDRIVTPADLVPDESKRVEGIVTAKDQPVAGAEVILLTPADESLSYKGLDVYIVSGRLRNRFDEVVADTNDTGHFVHYPTGDTAHTSLLAIHPTAGIGMLSLKELKANKSTIHLLPWAQLTSELAPEPGRDQSASIRTHLREHDGFPEISLTQYWEDLKNKKPTTTFGFTHVPPIWDTSISRDFSQKDGGSSGVSGASVSLLPGESREINLGPLSEKQREMLKWQERESQSRRGAVVAPSPNVLEAQLTAPETAPPTPEGTAPNSTPNTLTGRVTDENSNPLQKVEVFVFRVRHGGAERTELGHKAADAEGNFRVDRILDLAKEYPDGKFPPLNEVHDDYIDVILRAPGRASIGWAIVPQEVGKLGLHRDFVLPPGNTLEGTIKDPTGRPVSGALVALENGGAGPWEDASSSRTDATGHYAITDALPFDPATQQFVEEDLRRQNKDAGRPEQPAEPFAGPSLAVMHPKFATKLEVIDRSPGFQHVTLQPIAAMKGRVIFADKKPASGVTVSVATTVDPADDSTQRRPRATAYTDQNGQYSITSLPAGKYDAWAEMPGWINRGVDGFEAAVEQPTTIADLVLNRGGMIRARLVDVDTKKPIAIDAASSATFTVTPVPLDPSRSISNDKPTLGKDGRYELNVIPDRQLVITVGVEAGGVAKWFTASPVIANIAAGKMQEIDVPVADVAAAAAKAAKNPPAPQLPPPPPPPPFAPPAKPPNKPVSLKNIGDSTIVVNDDSTVFQGQLQLEPRTIKATYAADETTPKVETPAKKERTPGILSYGDGEPNGKKSYGGSGQMILFELPEGVTKVKGIRIHGSRYGLPQAPNEDFEITFLSENRDENLHTESAPYKLFKRGAETWVRIPFDKEVELPKKFWIALDFNAEQTKGVYVSYDTSTNGEHSRVGKAGDKEAPKETDFHGDWMIQVILAPPAK